MTATIPTQRTRPLTPKQRTLVATASQVGGHVILTGDGATVWLPKLFALMRFAYCCDEHDSGTFTCDGMPVRFEVAG